VIDCLDWCSEHGSVELPESSSQLRVLISGRLIDT
jgi:hypothetical protein